MEYKIFWVCLVMLLALMSSALVPPALTLAASTFKAATCTQKESLE